MVSLYVVVAGLTDEDRAALAKRGASVPTVRESVPLASGPEEAMLYRSGLCELMFNHLRAGHFFIDGLTKETAEAWNGLTKAMQSDLREMSVKNPELLT